MSETTILEKRPTNNGQQETKKESGAWKHVTLGGVSGIFMGAGLLYAGQAVAQPVSEEPATENAEDQAADVQVVESSLQVASSHDDMSFGEAFAAARAEVGPGGVFYWHGGIYNTYTAAEWDAMTPEQKHDFAQQVQPEIDAHHVDTPTDTQPDVAVQTTTDDVQVVNEHEAANTIQTDDADVHIVGQGEIDGHAAVALDLDNDDNADIAIIDINDNNVLDADDVAIDTEGNVARIGDLAGEPDPNQLASMENPDVAPDMPDYMNDAMLDA